MANGGSPERSDRIAGVQSPLGPLQISSTDLFAGRREVAIEHAGEIYRLRITGKGKLILTK